MDGVEESKHSGVTPTEQPSSGNSEKTFGLENETAIVIEPDKTEDSKSKGDGNEGGGYASYAVSGSSSAQQADSAFDEFLTNYVCVRIEAMDVRDTSRRSAPDMWWSCGMRRRLGTWDEGAQGTCFCLSYLC
jgi:hypothetical protein